MPKPGGGTKADPMRLLANLRYYGYNINPIACYYCFDADEQLCYIVAEVTNTPWNERRSYVLACDPAQAYSAHRLSKGNARITVQPDANALPLAQQPAGQSIEPPPRNRDTTAKSMSMRQWRSSAVKSIAAQSQRHAAAHPWMTAKVAFAIYWQALKTLAQTQPVLRPSSERPRRMATQRPEQFKVKL